MMRRIDLLPEKYAARRRERRNISLILISGVLVFLLLLFYWIILGSQISTEEDNLRAAQQTNAQLQAQIAELQRFADLDAEVTAKRQALQTVMAGDIRWPGLLTEIAMVIPGEVWLTNLAGSAGMTEGAAPVGTETAAIRISNKTPVGRIQFSGNALSFPGVARWLIRQGTVDAFSAIWLNSASAAAPTEGVPGIVAFDSTLELGEDALSDRFQGGRL
jgi:Tfp pilus assembly protein PilN